MKSDLAEVEAEAAELAIGSHHLPRAATAADVQPPLARLAQLECSVHALAQRRLEIAVLLPAAPAVVLIELVQVAKLRLGGPRGVVDATPVHDDIK